VFVSQGLVLGAYQEGVLSIAVMINGILSEKWVKKEPGESRALRVILTGPR